VSATHSYETRGRHRWMLPLAVLTAGFMLVVWFPMSSLWHQQSVLNAASAQIQQVQRQEASLKSQSKALDTKAAATQLAREQYQLVSPGQSLIQVLPGDSAGGVSPSSADPGNQPLVSPSEASLPTTPSSSSSSTTTKTHHVTNGFVSRLERTLEFWR
jgi:cell division protein FtsB